MTGRRRSPPSAASGCPWPAPGSEADGAVGFAELWDSLLPVGRDPGTGGYRRFSFTAADAACREWFCHNALERSLRLQTDRNGNLWAHWDVPVGWPSDSTIATGSHLDSVPDGGAYDGPLGVAAGFAAIDLLRERGFVPARPIAVAAFGEEEGGRFGVACLGSRLLTGVLAPQAARELRDGDGVTLAEAMTGAGLDPARLGAGDELLDSLGAFVELHIEQGRALHGLGAAVGLAEGIWPHGRWRLDFTGRADHAGTTRLPDRRDPMLPYAATVLAARQAAASHAALATFGKVIPEPGGANAICSAVRAWLDARAPDEAALHRMVEQIEAAARQAADGHGVEVGVRLESFTPRVDFDPGLRSRLAGTLAGCGITAPVLPTGAGHDAGILAARLPAAMLFVRNPSGVSHSPAEHADPADCEAGVAALAAVLEELAGR